MGYQEYYLALEQARAGHAVHVISSKYRQHTVAVAGPDEALGAAELRDAGVTVNRLPGRQLGHDRAWLRGLGQAIADARPEAAHVHGPFTPTTVRAVRAATKCGATVLVDNHLHEEIAPGSSSPKNRVIYGAYSLAFGRYLRRHVQHWVGNGPHEARFLSERLGLNASQVELVPLGFATDVFGWDPDRRRNARAALGADTATTVISVTGKIHTAKRPEATAAAAEQRALTGDVLLVLAGSIDADSRRAIEAAAPTLHARGRVLDRGMLGRQELSDVYHASDAVVFARLPSISIYEAAGTGAVVLVGRDPFSDWLAGRCASIRSVDIAPLDLSMITPSNDADRGARAGAAAEQFAWRTIADGFVTAYAGGSTHTWPEGGHGS